MLRGLAFDIALARFVKRWSKFLQRARMTPNERRALYGNPLFCLLRDRHMEMTDVSFRGIKKGDRRNFAFTKKMNQRFISWEDEYMGRN